MNDTFSPNSFSTEVVQFHASLEQGLPGWLDGFLPEETCRAMLAELPFCFWTKSTVIRRSPLGELQSFVSFARESETTDEFWFPEPLSCLVRDLEGRLSDLLGYSIANFEPWQIVRYGKGGVFTDHHDAGFWAARRNWPAMSVNSRSSSSPIRHASLS